MKSNPLCHRLLQSENIPVPAGAFGSKINFGFGYCQFRRGHNDAPSGEST
jgi:hypothetical protein